MPPVCMCACVCILSPEIAEVHTRIAQRAVPCVEETAAGDEPFRNGRGTNALGRWRREGTHVFFGGHPYFIRHLSAEAAANACHHQMRGVPLVKDALPSGIVSDFLHPCAVVRLEERFDEIGLAIEEEAIRMWWPFGLTAKGSA